MPTDSIEQYIRDSAAVRESLVDELDSIKLIVSKLIDCVRAGGRIYTCGNGGSACDAMHLVEELVARYDRERPGIPAQHLIDAGTITCWSNDYTFGDVFRRQVETLCNDKDALIAFSTSGNSENIVTAIQAAKKKGVQTIGLLGKDGGKAKAECDLSLIVKSNHTAHIQEAHIVLVHIICEQLEQKLF